MTQRPFKRFFPYSEFANIYLKGIRQPLGQPGENQNFRIRYGLHAGRVQIAAV